MPGRTHLKALLDLGRIANLPTVCTNLVAAAWLTGSVDGHLLPLLLGASLLYTAGCTLNDAFDHDFDRRHRPERPIPSGTFSLRAVWAIGLAQLLVGALILGLWAGCAWWVILALVSTILVYDAVHKLWTGSVLLMGLCRALLYLLPASIGGHGAFPIVELQAAGLLLYIVGISLTARQESQPGGTIAGWTSVLLFMPLVPWALHALPRGATAIVWIMPALFIAIVIFAIRTMRRKPPSTIGPGVERLLAGICLIDAMILAPVAGNVALLLAAGYLITRLLQRYFAST